MIRLGKINKVDLRQAWQHEAHGFTTWLAQEENLGLLSEEIGCEIELIQQEAAVGRFSVDILAMDRASGRKMVIENQLEVTDHDHLGKIITYAAGHSAGIVVWIVKEVREEHRRAIDWLNENTGEDLEFFLLQIELWQIEGSLPAPKFEMICKPNGWAKSVRESTGRGEASRTQLKQLEFWSEFHSYAASKQPALRLHTPRPQHWLNLSVGSSVAHLSLTVSMKEKLVGLELYISDNKDAFAALYREREAIEQEIGFKLEWKELPARKASRVKVTGQLDPTDEANWVRIFDWMLAKIILFRPAFAKRLQLFSRAND